MRRGPARFDLRRVRGSPGDRVWRMAQNRPCGTGWPLVLTFCCGFFRALGGALAAISNQGEFRSLTNRSKAMREQRRLLLKGYYEPAQTDRRDTDLSTRQFSTGSQSTFASGTAGFTINEVLDWRVILLDQPLRPPT